MPEEKKKSSKSSSSSSKSKSGRSSKSSSSKSKSSRSSKSKGDKKHRRREKKTDNATVTSSPAEGVVDEPTAVAAEVAQENGVESPKGEQATTPAESAASGKPAAEAAEPSDKEKVGGATPFLLVACVELVWVFFVCGVSLFCELVLLLLAHLGLCLRCVFAVRRGEKTSSNHGLIERTRCF
jgi:hypothetical protein